MKALRVLGPDQAIQLAEVEKPIPGIGEVLVKLHAAALNHRDVWITKGKYPGLTYPTTLGSDGAGTDPDGRSVLIQPGIGWGKDERFQDEHYHILGMPNNGTFAEYVMVPRANLHSKPAHLSWEQAAALPLAGLTAYRAVFTKGKAKAGRRVLISGIGGGVALMAAQLASAAGCKVWATSGNEEKIKKAKAKGIIVGGVNYRDNHFAQQLKKLSGGFDLIIDGAGGKGFADLLKITRPGARVVVYGGGQGKAPLSPQAIFWKQVSILGSSMGSPKEFGNLLAFVREHRLIPVIDKVYPLTDGAEAFARMSAGEQFGKIILKIA